MSTRAHRAQLLDFLSANEQRLPPEQLALAQDCVHASTSSGMVSLQHRLAASGQRAQLEEMADDMQRNIDVANMQKVLLELVRMAASGRPVATPTQFITLLARAGAAAAVRSAAAAAHTGAADAQELVAAPAAAVAALDAARQDQQLEQLAHTGAADAAELVAAQAAALAAVDASGQMAQTLASLHIDAAARPLPMPRPQAELAAAYRMQEKNENEELAQAQAQDEHVRRLQAQQQAQVEAAEQEDMEAAYVSPRRHPHKRSNYPKADGPSPATTAAARRRRLSGDSEEGQLAMQLAFDAAEETPQEVAARRRAQEEQQWEEQCRLQAAAAQALAFAEAEAQEAAADAAADAQVQLATELAFAEAAAQDAAKAQREEAVRRLKEAEEGVPSAEAEAALRKAAAAAAAADGCAGEFAVGNLAGVAEKAEKAAAKARRRRMLALLWVKVLADAPDTAAAALGKHAHGRKGDPLTVLALAALTAFRSANPCGDGGIAKEPISGELTPGAQLHVTAIFWHYFDLGKGPQDLHCDVGAGRGAPQLLAALLLLVRTMGVEVCPLRVWVMPHCVAAGLAKWRELGGGGTAVPLRTTFSSHLADVLAGAPLRGAGGAPATHVQCFSTGMPDPVIDALARILNAMRSVVCVAAYHDLVDHGLRAEEQTALKTTVTMYVSGEAKTCRFFKMLSAAEWAERHPAEDEDDDDEDEDDIDVIVPVPGRFTVAFAEGAPADAPAAIIDTRGVPAQDAPGTRPR